MKKWRIFIIVFIIGGVVFYNYVYKDHRDIENEEPSFIVTSENLIIEFTSDNKIASEKYLDKTIQIIGMVTSLDGNVLQVESVISCYFKDTLNSNQLLNKKIEIKGRCIGYDELLEEIKIDQCVILTKPY
ncbi:MAG: hypothetical protein JKY73_05820 [Lutibacter sp.]|nr:hypothetical protein [Lutibacter sp.]